MWKSLVRNLIFVGLFLAFMPGISVADGDNNLNDPGLTLSGTGFVAAGVGLDCGAPNCGPSSGIITVDIPAGATVNAVILYWAGQFDDEVPQGNTDTITVNGTPVVGDLIGSVFFAPVSIAPIKEQLSTFRADLTSRTDIPGLPLTSGSNNLVIGGVDFSDCCPTTFQGENHGAGVLVVIDDGTGVADLQLRDGEDYAFINQPLITCGPPSPSYIGAESCRQTEPQTYSVNPSATDQMVDLTLFAAGINDRGNTIEITVSGPAVLPVTTTLVNPLGDSDGSQWDTFTTSVNLPAGADSVTVQIFSTSPPFPASLSWVASAIAGPPAGEPDIEILKQVSLDGVNFFDADNPADLDVPIGIVSVTDATYRLIVKNIGTETLVNVQITDATLGLVDVTIADLMPGETRIINSGDAGFGNLFFPGRCEGTPGNKANMATVTAIGKDTQTLVSDDNPANVRCIEGPEIQLLKQISLTGDVPFFDADTAAAGPTGLLGADATYRIIVKNVGDEPLTNIIINDSTLGIINAVIDDLPIGGEVTLDVGSFGGALFFENRCDAVGEKLNTAAVNADGFFTGTPVQDTNPAYVNCDAPAVCNIAVDKTCLVAPPSGNEQVCTNAISATTLRYTGMSLNDADVTFSGKDGGLAEYTGVNLDSGTTILTMAGQNGFTIDAGLGNKLGSQTTIIINNVVEIIHTSCSAIYVAGQPAPLDANTPNPSGASKGDPSLNWSVVNFRQQDDVFIEEPNGGQQGANACTVPFGGAEVSFEYTVMNTGTTNVDVTSVLDDILGERLTSPPAMLGPSDSLTLSGGPVFIDQDTTNVVNVIANVSGDSSAVCLADDTVEVTVEPPPLLSCADGKPIKLVFEYTGEECEANPANPQDGKFTCSGDPNDAAPVQLVVEMANADPSTETISIGDFVTIMPSGDKFDSQTDFEIKQGGSVLQDLSMHLSCSQDLNVGDRFGSLTLRVFVPGTDSGGMGGMGGMGGDGGGVEAVAAVFKEIKGKEFKFDIDNTGGTDVTIVRITTLWPTGVNGVLTEIKRGKSKIYDTDTPVSPAAITTWIDTESKRLIKNGEKKEFKLKFKNDADTNLGNYSVEIEFDTGTIVTIS